jgi:uncharacterized protein (DUF1800 family)
MDGGLREPRLLERAGFGTVPGELEALRREGPDAWLQRQLADPRPRDPELEARLARFPSLAAGSWQALMGIEIPREMSARRLEPEVRKQLGQRSRQIFLELAGSRVVRAVHGRFALREVMLDFWANHFSVFGHKSLVGALLPHYQREVLLPHALGRFEDLLLAVARSPAMLVYLDNWTSTAPDLPRFVRRIARVGGGINENYARELLELHTLGVDGGYSQQDVIEVARVFTGWTLESRRDPVFRFRDVLHDDGPKQVLGQRIRGRGVEEGEELLRRLARQPATARFVSRKLVARFVSDAPPPQLVERAARRFLASEGDIRQVVATILRSAEFADPARRKLKTPLRLAASALRETAGQTDGGKPVLFMLGRLGEVPYAARTPAGYPEDTSYWVDPGAMLERMGFAFALAGGFVRGTWAGRSPSAAAARAPGSAFRAESLALAWAAPEFQWA